MSGQAAPATPGQAAYEAYAMAAPDEIEFSEPGDLLDWERAAWEAGAQAAIAAHPVVALMGVKRDAALRESRELRREQDRLGELLEKTSVAKCNALDERDRLTERVAELVTEVNELRALVAEMYAHIATLGYASPETMASWRERAGLDGTPAVVTAGTGHLAAEITRLAIGTEDTP